MIKAFIKRILPKEARDFIWQRRRDLLFLVYLLRRIVRQIVYRSHYSEIEKSLKQYIFTHDVSLPFDSVEGLSQEFTRLNFKFSEGRHTFYLYRDNDIEKLSKKILSFYPYKIGLKIIKSAEISNDGTPYYTSSKVASRSSTITSRAVGSIREKMIISNILNLRGVAPRVYDIVRLRFKNRVAFAMVVQHIEGDILKGEAAKEFMRRFKRIIRDEYIQILGEKDHVDFRPPDYRNNIISNREKTYYVDIQNFAIFDKKQRDKQLSQAIQEVTHFGDSRIMRPSEYAYQSVPGLNIKGKRDTLYRIYKIQDLLDKNNISLKGHTVLDIGCNLGIFIMHFLSKGARWGVGLDMPKIVNVATRFLIERGFSRFDLIGADLSEDNVIELLPLKDYEMVLYLSIEKHIGFPDWLNRISFRYFLYEGHSHETVKDIKTKIKTWRPDIKIIDSIISQDGDSEPRPILLCTN